VSVPDFSGDDWLNPHLQAAHVEALLKGKKPSAQRIMIWTDLLANTTIGLKAVRCYLNEVGNASFGVLMVLGA
jgi:hypothetical protein